MRRKHRMRRLANGCINRNGFLLEHVDTGTPELARDKRLGQRIGIHDGTTRGVDDDGVGLHGGDALRIKQMMRLGRQRRVKAHDIGPYKQVVQAHVREVLRREASRHALAVPDHDVEAKSAGLARRRPSDMPVPDNAEAAPLHLPERAAFVKVPHALPHIGIHLVDATQHAHRERDGVIGDDLRTVAGNIANRSTVLGGRSHVDVVDARTRLAHHPEPRQRLEHLGGIVTI